MRIIPVLSLLLLVFLGSPALAGGDNPGDVIIHHLVDLQEWQPLPYLPAIPLPTFHIGGFTFPITGHVVMMWIASLILCATCIPAFRKGSIVPRGIAGILEPVVLFVRDEIVYPSMGAKMGRQWLPFFATVFLFILTCNLMGLIPLFRTATGNVNITAGMSLIILILIFGAGMKYMGPFGFFKNLIPKGTPWPLVLIIFPIELIGFFIKAFALCLRLFANMMAGHIVILALLALIFILHPLAAFLSVPFALGIYLLEILVALIQALVFTLLSSVFIGMACHHH